MVHLVPIKANPNLADKSRPIIELTKFGNLLCYEKCSGRWFRSSQWHVEDALAQLQGLYENNVCINLNDLFELLGIYTTNRGSIYGWNSAIHGERTLLFSTSLIENNFMTMDEPVLVLSPNVFPEKDYKEAF